MSVGVGRRDYVGRLVNGRSTTEHILVAEKALGKPLPRGAVVHHWDCNKKNNQNRNLLICPDQSYHRLIHIRMEAFDSCGNAGFRKCTWCKVWCEPTELAQHGTRLFHPVCHKAYCRDQYHRRGI